jgi:hypothetical protein
VLPLTPWSRVSCHRVGPGGVEPPPSGYRPLVLPLNHGPDRHLRSAPGESNPSSLTYKGSALPLSEAPLGPEGFEPPPPGLKGRCAAVTPRPRRVVGPGLAFDPPHVTPPVGMAGFEPAVSWSQARRISQAFPHPARVRAAGFEPAVSSPPSLRIAGLSHALRGPGRSRRRSIQRKGPVVSDTGPRRRSTRWSPPGVTRAGDRRAGCAPVDRRGGPHSDNRESDSSTRRSSPPRSSWRLGRVRRRPLPASSPPSCAR